MKIDFDELKKKEQTLRTEELSVSFNILQEMLVVALHSKETTTGTIVAPTMGELTATNTLKELEILKD